MRGEFMSSPEQTVAAALIAAHRQRCAVDAAALASLLQDPDQAYAVQAEVARTLGWFDQPVPQHWKSGGPSREAVLTHAALPPQRVWPSPADARAAHFNLRLIEVEVALRLGRDVTPQDAQAADPATAQRWLDGMAVSIEIVDSRWRQARDASALLKLADLQSHGALVLGAWQPFAPRDWAQQACTVWIGQAAPMSYRGTHSLQDPSWLLPAWARHVTRHGDSLPRGSIVTTGTWCGLLEARQGDTVRAVFDGIGEAQVQL
jgi:2-keto-4-pentenoate hydratase